MFQYAYAIGQPVPAVEDFQLSPGLPFMPEREQRPSQQVPCARQMRIQCDGAAEMAQSGAAGRFRWSSFRAVSQSNSTSAGVFLKRKPEADGGRVEFPAADERAPQAGVNRGLIAAQRPCAPEPGFCAVESSRREVEFGQFQGGTGVLRHCRGGFQ